MTAQELGRIERPETGDVLARRKVYIVTLVYPSPDAPVGYSERLTAYWKAVDEHVGRLERRAGHVTRIFHEGIGKAGDEGLKIVETANAPAHFLLKTRISAGATLEPFDDEDLFGQVIDWSRCLQAGLFSQKVVQTVTEAYSEAVTARTAHLVKRLEEGIGEAEAALLLATSTRSLKMPADAEIFNVVPPELDALERWMRQAAEEMAREAQDGGDAAPPQGAESRPGPKLWTPS